jgi:predicted oxidoreductase
MHHYPRLAEEFCRDTPGRAVGNSIGSASHEPPPPGLYAAGEVAGFGGGGVHGYNALEGTFLGGCIFSGRALARA